MAELKISHKIYRKYNLFTAVAGGDITYDDLYLHVLELMSDTYFQPGTNGLYDFSQVTNLSGDLSKWESLAEGMTDKEIIPIEASTAIVLAKDNKQLWQVMADYLAMTAGSKIAYQLFDENQWQAAMNHVELNEFADLNRFEMEINGGL